MGNGIAIPHSISSRRRPIDNAEDAVIAAVNIANLIVENACLI
jgi:mannitol/fructose-specific phosphotransferase system IIA component